MPATPIVATLPHLDREIPLDLDPGCFAANLAALREHFPLLADELARTPLPRHWRAVRALDGGATLRCEAPGETPRWLDDSAVPDTRAAELLAGVRDANQPAALPGIGSGAEVAHLLEHFPASHATYVFETDPLRLAAVLRIRDLSSAIRNLRCILPPTDHVETELAALFGKHPGLLPPGLLIRFPHTPAARAAELQGLCARLAQARIEADPPVEARATGGVCVTYLGADPLLQRLAAELTDAAAALGSRATLHLCDQPRHADPAWHLHVLRARRPQWQLLVDGCGAFAEMGTRALWHVRPPSEEHPPAAADLHLASTPQIAEALRTAGFPPAKLLDFPYWAPHPATPGEASAEICLLCDLPDDDARACGISQPTHEILWRAVRSAAALAWERPRAYDPFGLLRTAERESGIELAPESLRQAALLSIEQRVIPAAIARAALHALAAERITPRVLGCGWNRNDADETPEAHSLATDPCAQLDAIARGPRRLLVVLGRRAALGPVLLSAAVRGWPLLVHDPGGDGPLTALRGILHRGQHCATFAGAAELRTAARSWTADPKPWLGRAETTGRVLQSAHDVRRRWETLLAAEGGPPTPN